MADKKGASSEKVLYCSFCGKSQHEVKKLIAGPSVFICDECIDLCIDIIRDEVPAEGEQAGAAKSDLPLPSEIKDSLDGYVIGQDAAKRTLAFPTLGAIPRDRADFRVRRSAGAATRAPAGQRRQTE